LSAIISEMRYRGVRRNGAGGTAGTPTGVTGGGSGTCTGSVRGGGGDMKRGRSGE